MGRVRSVNATQLETRASLTDHHEQNCQAALGTVKARRSAPPAPRAAAGLDRASAQPGRGSYVMVPLAVDDSYTEEGMIRCRHHISRKH